MIERYRGLRRQAGLSAVFAACGLLALAAPSEAQSAAGRAASAAPGLFGDEPRSDPRAVLLLKRMGDAYARLGAFDLRIDISSALVPLQTVPDSTALSTTNVNPTPFQVDEASLRRQGRVHLAFHASNHLLIETEQTDAVTGKPFDVRWISDGQSFWSYTGDKKVYTREKAPGSIHDFARLKYLNGGTLELLMLIGPNPYAELLESVESARRIGEAEVRGVPTEIVSLQLEDPLERSEVRLYIGRDDGLLRRMEIESIPVVHHDGPIKVGSKLDGLLDAVKPPPLPDGDPSQPSGQAAAPSEPPAPTKPVGAFVRFENDLDLRPDFPAGTFQFVPPKGALMMGEQPLTKHLTMKQRIAQMAKNIRQKRAEMLRNAER